MRVLSLLILGAGMAWALTTLIVPGQSVGPLRPDTRRADVERLLGLKPEEVADGTSNDRESTEVWPLDKSRRLILLWAGEKLDSVVLAGDRSVWKTREGVSLGTSLASLVKLNGKPFVVQSFEGEHAGEVLDWQGGQLAGYRRGLKLTLSLRVPGYNKLTGEQKVALEAPGRLHSNQPLMKTLNPVVSTLEVDL